MTPIVDRRFADVLCPNTSKLPRPEWLDLRRPYIGSSEASTTLGLNPWDHLYALMAAKKGLLPDREASEHMEWGTAVEPIILAKWLERNGHSPRSCRRHVMLRSKRYPFMAANPDGLLAELVVEVKTADRMDRARWEAGVPDHYVLQAHHLMIVAGKRLAVFPVLFGGNELVEFIVEWTQETADNLIAAETAFVERMERTDWPDPDGSEAAMLALRARFYEFTPGVEVELDFAFAEQLNVRAALAEQVKRAERDIDDIKARVMEAMGHANAEVATLLGEKVATWRTDKNGRRTFRFTTTNSHTRGEQ